MSIGDQIHYASPDELLLDSKNPRLGRHITETNPSQEQILNTMASDWSLEELATSFLESGFWPQEALVVVVEKVASKDRLVVVEGNRRLAALKWLKRSLSGDSASKKWHDLAKAATPGKMKRLSRIPYVIADNRADVQAYLGFRHVSGIKEWKPAEKAAFIAHLIDDSNLSFEQVMRRIGSKTPTVRLHYVAFRVLKQMEGSASISLTHVERRFSVLYLALRTHGVRDYLGIDLEAKPNKTRGPIPRARVANMARLARWLFGDKTTAPIVTDSRHVDTFARILLSSDAVEYLERTPHPVFAKAAQISGGDEQQVITHIERAADEIQEALRFAHRYRDSARLAKVLDQLAGDVAQLLVNFPEIQRVRFARND